MKKKDTQYQWEKIKNRILDAEELYIYGAGVVAYGIYRTLLDVLQIKPKAFVVTEKPKLSSDIESVPIISVQELSQHANILILVATPELYHEQIKQTLSEKEIQNVIYIDNHMEFLFMHMFYKKNKKFSILMDAFENVVCENYSEDIDEQVGIYMAKCHVDKPLKNKVEIPEWVIPIQVGKALTDQQIAELCDDTGEHISHKNGKYSELTATYWVWKNVEKAYKGICHYRRQLLISKEEMNWLIKNDIDVVLPLPFVCYPDAKGQYGRYISEEDQKILFQALGEVSPEYAKEAELLLKKPYLYNYNMLLAKTKVFDAYCAWMFPILFRAEQLREEKTGDKNDRFAGYFGEVLTSVYFMKNKDKLKIVHAEKVWYV